MNWFRVAHRVLDLVADARRRGDADAVIDIAAVYQEVLGRDPFAVNE